MKQKDVALILIIAFVSAVAAFFISATVFTSSHGKQTAEIVDPIDPTFNTADSKYFNSNSIDPTQLIQIGDSTNSDPFSGASQ